MAKITPKLIDDVFDKSVLNELPENSDIKRGVGNRKRSDDPEYRKKLSDSLKGIPKSEEQIEKRRQSMPDKSGENNSFYGKIHSEETRKKISEKKKGNIPTNKGSKHKEEDILKMMKPRSEKGKANMRKPKTQMLTCTICGKTGASGNMIRYHMENPTFGRTPKCKPNR